MPVFSGDLNRSAHPIRLACGGGKISSSQSPASLSDQIIGAAQAQGTQRCRSARPPGALFGFRQSEGPRFLEFAHHHLRPDRFNLTR